MSQPPPLNRALAALSLVATALAPCAATAQGPGEALVTDALRYSVTRGEYTVYAAGTDVDAVPIGMRARDYHGPAQTTTYLALVGDDGETAVTMSYPADEPDVPGTAMRRPSHVVTTLAGVTSYARDGGILYELPATSLDSSYLREYDFSLSRVSALRQNAPADATGTSNPKARSKGDGEPEPEVIETFDAERLVRTVTTMLDGAVVATTATAYGTYDAPGGAIAFPLFESSSRPFDEEGVRGTHFRTLTYSAPEYGPSLRQTLRAEAGDTEAPRLTVSPSPAAEYVRITGGVDVADPDRRLAITVYAMDGRVVLALADRSPDQFVDVSALAPGPYIFRVEDAGVSSATTFVKK